MSDNPVLENPIVVDQINVAETPNTSVADDAWVLDLGDLIADAQGEIVVSEVGDAQLTIQVGTTVSASGLASGHVTQDGFDVSGFHFVTFENGITLYYDDGVSLSLLS
jgi:hypothetical protein